MGCLIIQGRFRNGIRFEIHNGDPVRFDECAVPDALQKDLLDQVEADEINFVPLAKAYGIPKDDPNRDTIMEEASMRTCSFSAAEVSLSYRS